MERASFGPALWAVVPLDEVGRLARAGGVSQEEQGDAHVQAVAGMARAESPVAHVAHVLHPLWVK